ncbi:MAG: hypothetical protein KDC66_21080 [Phaeodactylibacter sp.]|nr:hypothetical protein [Phaeodactylibacter sp.]MCB9275339.1 hypothetical protein [Lewinellaceae bacterium]
MYANKLIQLLKSFGRREMTRFLEFAHSPYFNKHDGVRALVAYLSDVFPAFGEQNCEREVVFQALYPGEPHDQPRLALLFTYTKRLAEHFLRAEQLEGAPREQDLLLLRGLRERQQYQIYDKALQEARARAHQAAFRDSGWYYHQYQLASEADFFYTLTSERRTDHSLEQKQEALDRFYLAEKLRDACEMEVRSRILKLHHAHPQADWAVQEVGRQLDTYLQEPAIAIYYRLYRMISEGGAASYFEARHALEECQPYLAVPELKAIYNYLQNHCIQQINQGEEPFLEEIFRLYQAQLDRGLLLEGDYLSEWHYKNIVTTGLRLHELGWVRQFIEAYREKLPPEVRDNAFRFNLASYYYAARQYGEVLRLLTQVEYSDLRYNLGAKALLLRTYYDLGEYEALASLTESFKQYLHRNKLMADVRRQGYYNLFMLTRRAASLRFNLGYYSTERSRREMARLQNAIGKADAIFNKGWLQEKVASLAELVGKL